MSRDGLGNRYVGKLLRQYALYRRLMGVKDRAYTARSVIADAMGGS